MSEYGAPPPPPPYGAMSSNLPPWMQGAEIASMGRRLAARVIDVLLLSVVGTILGAVIFGSVFSQIETDAAGNVTEGQGAFLTAYFGYITLFSLLALAYEVAFIAVRGATIGMQVLGVSVLRDVDGGLLGWGPSFLRWLIPFLGSFVCGIGQLVVYISPFFDSTKRNQGWHDKVAKDFVIKR